MFVGFFVVAYY